MKIVSVYSFELPDCKTTQFTEYTGNQYMMYFECGLVMSSWFLRRLYYPLRDQALRVHRTHHDLLHGLDRREQTYSLRKIEGKGRLPAISELQVQPSLELPSAQYYRERNKISIICGPSCRVPKDLSYRFLLDQSDVLLNPLATIKENGNIITVKITASNQILCSCTPYLRPGELCSHIIKLLSGSQSGVISTSNNRRKSPVRKRKMMLDG